MKKLLMVIAALALVLSLVAVPLLAAQGDNPANDNPNNLYLYQKDADWEIVWGGAWGKMNFKLDGSILDFVFNGHELEKNTAYSLIYYPGEWPDYVEVLVIAEGTTNNGGNIHLSGVADLEAAPQDEIDVWNPEEYLFEYKLIEDYKIRLIKTADLDESPGG